MTIMKNNNDERSRRLIMGTCNLMRTMQKSNENMMDMALGMIYVAICEMKQSGVTYAEFARETLSYMRDAINKNTITEQEAVIESEFYLKMFRDAPESTAAAMPLSQFSGIA